MRETESNDLLFGKEGVMLAPATTTEQDVG